MLPIQLLKPAETEGAERPEPLRPAPRPPSLRTLAVHAFLIALELVVFGIQYSRMEIFAFDMFPAIADQQFAGIYGSHAMATAWLMLMILISYGTWEATVRAHALGPAAPVPLRGMVAAFWIANLAAMVLEFAMFRLVIEDRSGGDWFLAAEIFSALLVFGHQVASWWVVTNILPQFLFARSAADAAPAAPDDQPPHNPPHHPEA